MPSIEAILLFSELIWQYNLHESGNIPTKSTRLRVSSSGAPELIPRACRSAFRPRQPSPEGASLQGTRAFAF